MKNVLRHWNVTASCGKNPQEKDVNAYNMDTGVLWEWRKYTVGSNYNIQLFRNKSSEDVFKIAGKLSNHDSVKAFLKI